MSGAEAAGLAVGVIALASLFTTCVELLDYVERGKNYLQDYRLACTKINILHTRLSIWGGTAHILHPGHEHPLLRVPAKREAVGASLQSLRDVLSNTETLRRKYDLGTTEHPLSSANSQSPPQRTADWSLLLRRRTTWSIRDKAKFDKFIEGISFLMSNLEKVTESLGSSAGTSQMSPDAEKISYPTGMNVGVPLVKAKKRDSAHDQHLQIQSKDEPRKKGSIGSNPDLQKEHRPDTSKQGLKLSTKRPPAVETSFLEFTDCVQENEGHSSGLMGSLGHYAGRMSFTRSKQRNGDTSSGVQGAISEDTFLHDRKVTFGLESSEDDDN